MTENEKRMRELLKEFKKVSKPYIKYWSKFGKLFNKGRDEDEEKMHNLLNKIDLITKEKVRITREIGELYNKDHREK